MDPYLLGLEVDVEVKNFVENSKELYDSIKEGNADKVRTIIYHENCRLIQVFSTLHNSVTSRTHPRVDFFQHQIAKYLIANHANFKEEEFEISKEIFELLQFNNFHTKVKSFLDTIDILMNKNVWKFNMRLSIKLQLLKLAIEYKNRNIVDFILETDTAVHLKDGQEETPLHFVAKVGDIAAVQTLIKKEVNLNVTNTLGFTPLHIAVVENNIEMVKLLIENGANINCKDLEEKTPLHLAAANSHVEMVKVLLESGANVDECSKGKLTSLHTAVKTGNKKTVALLVEYNANVNATGERNETPLNIAAGRDHREIIKFLISKGALVNNGLNQDMILHMTAFNRNEELVNFLIVNEIIIQYEGATTLHLAVNARCFKIIELLLNNGTDVNEQRSDGNTALHIAVENEDVKTSEILLKYKANINIKNNCGKTPLYIAVEKGFLNLTIELLYYKPNPEINKSALHFAVKGKEQNHKKIIVFLKAHGYSINFMETYTYEETYDFIEKCVSNGHVELVDDLLKLGLDPNIAPPFTNYNENFRTLLHAAVENNQFPIVQLLVDNGCELNIRDKQGRTPMYYAIKRDNREMTKFLLDNNTKIHDDHKLFFLAIARGNYGIIEDFLKCYDDVNVQDELGMTALHFAAWNGDGKTLQLLFNKGACCKEVDHLAQVHLTSEMNRSISERYGEYALEDFQKNIATTPLHIATRKNRSDIVEVFLERGCDVNCRDGCGRTALHIAAFFDNSSVIDMLMEFNADLGALDEHGHTCLDYAFNRFNFSSTMFIDRAFLYIYDLASRFVLGTTSSFTCRLLTSYVAMYNSMKRKTEQSFMPCYDTVDYNSCTKEIEQLKETNLYGNITLYDVLVQDINTLAIHLKNEEFLASFMAQGINKKFPMYSMSLTKRIKRAKERRILLNEAEVYFTNVLCLPHVVSEKLMSYLYNGNLKSIRRTYELFHIQLGVKCKTT